MITETIPVNTELVQILQQILDDKKPAQVQSAYYCGGTLCVDWNKDESENLALLNFSNEDLSSEVKLLMAKLYVRAKSPTAAYYQTAQEIIASDS